MLLKNQAVANDRFTFTGDPVKGFNTAMAMSNKVRSNNPDTDFEIVYDSRTSEITLTFNRSSKISDFATLFGPGAVPGYLTDVDMQVIAELSQDMPEGTFVEVGSFLGKSTVEWARNFALNNKNHRIIAIDSFNTNIDILRRLLSAAGFDVPDSASQLEMFQHYTQDHASIRPLEAFFNQEFVFDQKVAGVFEDSEHTQQALSHALPYWWERIVTGGILSGHDYLQREVQVSVDAFALLHDLTVHRPPAGSSIWWIKK